MADQKLYFFNERGFLTDSSVFEPGATTEAPLPADQVPLGKTQRWNGKDWIVSDPDTGAGGGSGAGLSSDRELLVTSYRVKTAFAGASVGDTISATRMLDVSGSAAVQVGATSWFNETTNAALAGAPLAVNLEPMSTPGLTDAQLRAAAVRIGGEVAHDAVDSGSPVKIGGVVRNAPGDVVLAAGKRADAAMNVNGSLYVQQADHFGNVSAFKTAVDGVGSFVAPAAVTQGLLWNGTNWDRVRGNVNGLWAQGNIAAGAADAGNPLKVGAVYNSVAPTYTTGQRGDMQLDSRGNLRTAISQGTNVAAVDLIYVDGQGDRAGLATVSQNVLWNGAAWDRMRGNTNGAWAQGNVAHNAVDAGNPVKIGGKVSRLPPAAATVGNRTDAWFGQQGQLVISTGDRTVLGDGAAVNNSLYMTATDGNGGGLVVLDLVYNGNTWDRKRGDVNGQWMQGNVSSGVVDAGKPVKIGGVARSAANEVNVAASTRVDASFNTYGALYVQPSDKYGQELAFRATMADSMAGVTVMPVYNHALVYNPAANAGAGGWDRMRGNTTAGLLVNPAGETYSAVTIITAQTSGADGNVFTAFGNQACTSLDVVNNTTVDIEYQRGGAGNTMRIKAGASRLVQGITNANQIGIRRVDKAATAVTVDAEAYQV